LVAILDGSREHRTQIWKGAIQGSFHPPFFLICIIGQNRQKFKVHKKSRNMFKSSSLCFNSSNLGTFWLKIEQFWPFEEISIFSNGGHPGYRTALTDTILKGDHLRIIQTKFGWNWPSGF
jgi:hypothetical protein